MALRTTPAEFAAKWVRRTGAASEDYKTGIMRVDRAPGEMAAARANAYIDGVNRSKQIWQDKVAAVSLSEWQNAATVKGSERYTSGTRAAENKMARVAVSLLQNVEAAVQAADRVPRGTFEQNMERSRAFAEVMHAAKGKIR